MIVASHGIIGSSIGQFDFDYQAILDYAITQGDTLPSVSQQILQNQLLIDLKNAGVWNKLDTLVVFASDAEDSPGSGTSNFALIDWKRLVDYTAVNAPLFTPNEGFEGNGSSAYLIGNYAYVSNWVNVSQNNVTAFQFNWKDAFPLNNYVIQNQSNVNVLINPRNSFDSYAFRLHNGAGAISAPFIKAVGMHSTNRNNASSINYFIDGVLRATHLVNSVDVNPDNMQLFATTSISNFSGGAASCVGYGAFLNATENLDLFNAFNNYYNAL